MDKKFSVTNDTFVFKSENEITTKYIQKYLLTNIRLIEDTFQGTNHKHPTWERLSNILIPIPSTEIQELIVQQCDYYDNLINTLKKENEKLQNNNIIDIILKSITNDELIDNIFSDEINEINTVSSSETDSDNAPSPKPEKKVKKSKKTKSNEI